MSHVPPYRWADALAGKVTDAERAKMERHAESCAACARARSRVGRASDSFAQIRAQSAPELAWDSVRAKVHWHVSTERHQKVAPPGRARQWLGAFGGVALVGGAVALALVTGPLQLSPESPRPTQTPVVVVPRDVTVPAPAPVAQLIGIVNRATGDVMVDGILARDLFTRRLVAGTKLATGNGSVDVQFGAGTGFSLGARSMLELRELNVSRIELVIDGVVDVEVSPRDHDQKFVVVAGDRTIEVRGTQFRVRHDAKGTYVACRHGLVAVRDSQSATEIEVAGEREVEVPAGQPVAGSRVVKLSDDGLETLSAATPITIAWGNLDALFAGSAPLEIATHGSRNIRVDGVELGHAPLQVRVLPGRHTVEVDDGAGRYRRAGWVDVAGPGTGSGLARLEIADMPPPTRGSDERRRQLLGGVDRAKLARCTRAIAKSGLTGTYVQIEMSVDGNGAVGFLNVIDTDLPNATASCVQDALKEVRFGKGPVATWRQRIDL